MVMAVVRVLVVLGLLGSAWVHGDLWLTGYRDIAVIGPLFLVNVVAGVVIAGGVVVWRHWLSALAAVVFGIATLGAFALSATVGFFGIGGQVWGAPQVWGVVTEVVCIVGGVVLLARPASDRQRVNAG